MSDYTDSLRDEDDDDFKTFLLDLLDKCETQHQEAKPDSEEHIYWQGRKDSVRTVLACYLNRPEIADLNRTTVYAHMHNFNT